MIRILIADDHPIMRDGLKQILSAFDDITVAAEACDGNEVLALIRQRDFDALVLDMTMPGKSGIDLIRQIRADKPKLPILILSMHKEEQYAVRALKAGASGYLCKDNASSMLVEAIRRVAAGGVFVSPTAAGQLMQQALGVSHSNNAGALPHTCLSDREFDIFRMIAEGQSVTAIAVRLSLSVKTVSTHKTRILEKMGMDNAAALIRYALKHGLVDPGNDA